jgi:hypothetical protein
MANPYKIEIGKAEGKRLNDLDINRVTPEYYLLGYKALSLPPGILLGFFDPEDGDDMFLRNIG